MKSKTVLKPKDHSIYICRRVPSRPKCPYRIPLFPSGTRAPNSDQKMTRYDQSRVPELYGGTISLIVLATFFVVVRIIARKKSAANLWWDDFVIVVALVRDIQKKLSKSFTTELAHC